MNFKEIELKDYDDFHFLLNEYYRDGEDKDTDQKIIDDFIISMFKMIMDKELNGYIVLKDDNIIGFVIYMIDKETSKYSEIPGFGTIFEIGLRNDYRNCNYGSILVGYVESKMKDSGVGGFYVTPYGKAISFWEKCGYIPTGKIASNKMEIFTKNL